MTLAQPEIDVRARQVRLVLLDVDGVLTDGTVHISDDGTEAKGFSIRDGAAIIWAQRAGLPVGLLSGRPSGATSRRAEELGIRVVSQAGPDKASAFARILEAEAIESAAIAYMGDDLLDLPVLARVGLSAAPADAAEIVRGSVHWVSASPGGKGAVREFLELVLRATGRWDGIVAKFRT